ncbi:hypothetical protein BDN72DRAFT_965296 [Pluteus cervinus]|uniref:Uncharacterized protein n=1 Tax=Pluteus cervinus TaxID=181527 RepID=A0ACD3A7F2_9AGAR|nr:hypothetical protein BDN72DRAFT_965296 [Pluteus cervinus]
MYDWLSCRFFAKMAFHHSLPSDDDDYPPDVLALYGTFFGLAFIVFFITLYQYRSFSKSISNGTREQPKRFFGTLRAATASIVVFHFLTAITGRIHPYEGDSQADIFVRLVLKLSDIYIYLSLVILLEYYQQSNVQLLSVTPDGPALDSSLIFSSDRSKKYFYWSFAALVLVVDGAWEVLALVHLRIPNNGDVALAAFWTDQIHDLVFLPVATAYVTAFAPKLFRLLSIHGLSPNPSIKIIAFDLVPNLIGLCFSRNFFTWVLREPEWRGNASLVQAIVDIFVRGCYYVFIMISLTEIGREVYQSARIELPSDPEAVA